LESALAVSQQPTANGFAPQHEIKATAVLTHKDHAAQFGNVMGRLLRASQAEDQEVQTASNVAQDGGGGDSNWRDDSFFGPEEEEESGGAFAGPGMIGRRLRGAAQRVNDDSHVTVTDGAGPSPDNTDLQGGHVYGDQDPNRFSGVFSRLGFSGSS